MPVAKPWCASHIRPATTPNACCPRSASTSNFRPASRGCAAGNGCANSLNANGANLGATGVASLAADTLNKLFGDLESSFKAERRKLTEGGVEIETSATFAFKPNVLIARNKKCPRW